jgi:hypothetical protein
MGKGEICAYVQYFSIWLFEALIKNCKKKMLGKQVLRKKMSGEQVSREQLSGVHQ